MIKSSYVAVNFSQVVQIDPNQFVQTKIIDFLSPNFATFLAALAGIAIIRSLLKF